jgi:hypothetical protein
VSSPLSLVALADRGYDGEALIDGLGELVGGLNLVDRDQRLNMLLSCRGAARAAGRAAGRDAAAAVERV